MEETIEATSSAAKAETDLDLRAVVAVLSRRRRVVGAVLLAVIVLGALLTMRAQRIYSSSATVMIDSSAPEVLSNVREVYDLGATGYYMSKEYYETQYNVIRSQPVLQKAAAALGLSPKDLAERVRASGQAPLEARVAKDALHGLSEDIRRRVELLELHRVKDRVELQEILERLDVIAFLRRLVRVEPVKDSRLAAIVVEHSSAASAARIANAVADSYIEYNLDQKVMVTRSAASWLTDQMHELRDKLQETEIALYEFKKENNMVSVSIEDRQNMIAETLSQLNRSLSDAFAQRLALESRREGLRRVRDEEAPAETIGEVAASKIIGDLKASYFALQQELAELSERYTADHPKQVVLSKRLELLRATLEQEIDKTLAAIDAQYESAVGNERRLRAAIEEIKSEALEINKKEIDYNRLKRERDNNAALYDLVLKRGKEADLSQLLRVNNVRKLEQAEPGKSPVRPRVALNLLVAVFLGTVLAVVAAFVVDYLDNSIKSQEQIEQLVGLPFLGIVPSIKNDKAERGGSIPGRDQYMLEHPRSSVAECCRTIRTNLLFMSHDRQVRRILVTSSGPQEGKSTTTINLAITMAQSGARTLLVDTDMRRPRLHKSFGVDGAKGISSLIMGEVKHAAAIVPSGVPNLDLLPCGPIPPSPVELLHGESFARVVAELSRDYDRIFFDSPPVAAVADALVLARSVDGVVLVVHAGKTSWHAAIDCKRRLLGVGANMLGVVLNNVDVDSRRYGGYYRYYQYYHSPYGADADKA